MKVPEYYFGISKNGSVIVENHFPSCTIFSSMQLNDTKIQEFGRNDGIRTVFHCQDKFFILSISSFQKLGSDDTEGSLFPLAIEMLVENFRN